MDILANLHKLLDGTRLTEISGSIEPLRSGMMQATLQFWRNNGSIVPLKCFILAVGLE
jgi:hypothetical protein